MLAPPFQTRLRAWRFLEQVRPSAPLDQGYSPTQFAEKDTEKPRVAKTMAPTEKQKEWWVLPGYLSKFNPLWEPHGAAARLIVRGVGNAGVSVPRDCFLFH